LFFFFLTGVYTNAQPGKKNKQPADAVEYSKWSEIFLLRAPDAALLYSHEGLDKALEGADEKGKQYCYGSLAGYLTQARLYKKAANLLDSNLKYADSIQDDLLKIKTYRRKAFLLSEWGSQPEAGKQMDKALSLLRQVNAPEEIKLCNVTAALINYRATRRDKLKLAEDYIKAASKKKMPGFDGWAELLYGQIEDSLNNKEMALEHYLKAASFLQAERNIGHLSQAYHCIALWYRAEGNNDSAAHYAGLAVKTNTANSPEKMQAPALLASLEKERYDNAYLIVKDTLDQMRKKT